MTDLYAQPKHNNRRANKERLGKVMKTIPHHLLLFAVIVLFSLMACASGGSRSRLLNYEIRVPNGFELAPLSKIDVVSNNGASGTRAKFLKTRQDGNAATILSGDTLIFRSEPVSIVIAPEGRPAQVFELKTPDYPKLSTWNQWQKPNFIDGSKMPWASVMDHVDTHRSTDLPSNCMLVRFSITQWKGLNEN